jgi:methylated-DNA-[protein]-cysteine S-methyltransferase
MMTIESMTLLDSSPNAAIAMRIVPSPFGTLRVTASAIAVVGIYLPDSTDAPVTPARVIEEPHPMLDRAAAQLAEYFAREREVFDLPLAPSGTPFQRRVWQALCAIPYGETTSYGAIARTIGMPSGSRAVGAANGRNPIAIVVPCHRVIGASGDLTGYGGGLPVKRWLLDHERRQLTMR